MSSYVNASRVLGEDLAGLMVETRLLVVDQAPNRRDHRGDRLDDWQPFSMSMKSSSSRRGYSSHPQITILQGDRRGRAGVSGFRSDLVLDVSQSRSKRSSSDPCISGDRISPER